MDYSEKWGVDVEEAVKLALMDLKLSRDEVEVTVLEQPSKGFFGIGSKLAKVRVEKKKEEKKEIPAAEILEKEEHEENFQQKKNLKSLKKKLTIKNIRITGRTEIRKIIEPGTAENNEEESSLNIEVVNKSELEDVEEHEALDFLKDVTEKMGLTLSFDVKAGKDIVYIEMSGKDSGHYYRQKRTDAGFYSVSYKSW